jgi:hypothetical protein
MKSVQTALAVLLLLAATSPARADFKYTETSQVTGGALVKMMKFATVFARGDAKKQEQQALAPTTTTHYVKSNRLRTDNADGTSQIIDLDGRRIIFIDAVKKTYAVATFDDIRAAMQQAQQNMQQQINQQAQQNPKLKDTQVTVTPEFKITPGTGSRVILSQPTKETKVEMDLQMQATSTGAGAPPPGQPNSVSGAMVMNMDTYVAPGVTGYQEFAQFYRRMAQDVNWMTIPSAIHIDPRVSQGLSSLQQNSDALKGFPLLSYVSMSVAAAGQPQPDAAQDGAQKGETQQNPKSKPSNPPPSTSNSTADGSLTDAASAAVVNKIGGLFGRKKQQQPQDSTSSSASAVSAPTNSDPNALIEITGQVTSFSDSSLDGGLFDIPVGYTQIQGDPAQILAGGSTPQQQRAQ